MKGLRVGKGLRKPDTTMTVCTALLCTWALFPCEHRDVFSGPACRQMRVQRTNHKLIWGWRDSSVSLWSIYLENIWTWVQFPKAHITEKEKGTSSSPRDWTKTQGGAVLEARSRAVPDAKFCWSERKLILWKEMLPILEGLQKNKLIVRRKEV